MFSVLGHALQVVNLLDRLIKKENQTATVPLVSDIPPYVDNCQVVICNERGGRSIQSFGNPACASGRYENFTSLFSYLSGPDGRAAREDWREKTASNLFPSFSSVDSILARSFAP